jgi:tetratricopeptide (TPR) repeat protein
MRTIEKAMDTVALNHDGVDLMRQGNYQEAISVFRTVLRELLPRTALGDILCRVDQDEDVDLIDKVTRTFLSVRSVPLKNSLSLFNSSYQDHHTFSLFDRALIIDATELVASSFTAGKICTAVVFLFNMGLAHQLQGMQELYSQQMHFKAAMRLYKMATEILERCRRASGDDANGLLYLAVTNNMGHIYSHFCKTRVVQRCLKWLHNILENMERSNTDTLGDEFLPFYLNAQILRGQTALAAAAA